MLRLSVTLALTVTTVASAQSYKVIKSFGILTNVSGYGPQSPLVQGPDGTLYGTAGGGEGSVAGTVFKLNSDGTGFRVLKWFTNGVEGAHPGGGLVLSGSTLYGTAGGGSSYNPSNSGYGVVFKLNTDGSSYAVLKNFTGSDGASPAGGLVLAGSTLYGTAGGGRSGRGVVFKVNMDGSGYAVLKDFTGGSDGWVPCGGLVLGGSTLYGTTQYGGSSDPNNYPNGAGVVFKVNTDGSGYAVLKNFTGGSDGLGPNGGLVLAGSTLYGTTSAGGTSDLANFRVGAGVVFKVNTDGSGYAVLKSFTVGDGAIPYQGLVLAGSTLYGTTYYGGTSLVCGSGCGVVFEMNTDGSGYSVLKSFTFDDGLGPHGGLVLAGSTLYGTTGEGGSANHGVVFRVNTDGSGYAMLKSFTSSDGAGPSGGLVLGGSTLYGTAGGGSSDYGVVFKVNTNGSGYSVLKNFTVSDGMFPSGRLVLSGSMLYGTTSLGGGSSGEGVVFKVKTDGSGYAVLKVFSGDDGRGPAGLLLSGGTLYGTTDGGGSSGCGVVFKINTNGSGYTVLKTFTGSDGRGPAGLLLSGGTLYGTTDGGGSSDRGVVFKINTDGSGYAVLRSFAGSDSNDGAGSSGRLVLSGSTLYGTSGGGSSDYGVVFKISTDGSAYAVLKRFTGDDGRGPNDLVLAGSALYGTTIAGGSSDCGLIFRLNTGGSGYRVLRTFAGGDGQNPQGLLLAGRTFYGVTSSGGDFNEGVVFSAVCLSITTPPLSQTAEAGSTVGFRVEAASFAPGLAYRWFFGGTHALVGATNAFLELPNVQSAQAGAYTVVVTNLGFAMTSAPALLSVITPVDRRVVPALRLTGGTGSLLHLEYADNLTTTQWFSLSDVTLNGGPQFCFDSSPTLPAQRFYRGWQANGPKPVLDASMATEIPLIGAIGSSVRVDYINAIGPTDAWVTLDTATLTNTTQLYYDLTAFRQPTRLYRLVPVP